MPCPKRKHTRMRKGLRRTHWKLSSSNFSKCPQCGEPKLPHRVCPNCGFYNGELVVVKKEKTKKKETE
jgi:large subunit ribosomal protein L32